MIRGPPIRRKVMRKEPPIWIIRWSKAIEWPDGVKSNMCARSGTREEVERYAKDMAEIHQMDVVVIA